MKDIVFTVFILIVSHRKKTDWFYKFIWAIWKVSLFTVYSHRVLRSSPEWSPGSTFPQGMYIGGSVMLFRNAFGIFPCFYGHCRVRPRTYCDVWESVTFHCWMFWSFIVDLIWYFFFFFCQSTNHTLIDLIF